MPRATSHSEVEAARRFFFHLPKENTHTHVRERSVRLRSGLSLPAEYAVRQGSAEVKFDWPISKYNEEINHTFDSGQILNLLTALRCASSGE